jgi:hypothetical protein
VLHWEREWQAWAERHPHGEPLRLSPVIPIVFHTGPDPWRQRGGLADLFEMPPELSVFVPQWPLLYWDITDHTPEALLGSARQWLQALAVVRAEEAGAEAFAAFFQGALRRLEALSQSDPVRWRELLWFLLSWALRRRPDEEQAAVQRLAEESQTQTAIRKEVETMSQAVKKTWEQSMLEKGELRGQRKTIRRQLEKRFGPLPDPIAERLEAITDPACLEGLELQVLHVQSLDELQF